VWARTNVLVTMETPVEEAETIVRRVLLEETRSAFEQARHDALGIQGRYGRLDAAYEPHLFRTVEASGVNFAMIYVADCRRIPEMDDKLQRRLLDEFNRDARFQFAYPTYREVR
jgi:hypothetical protein